MIDPKVEVYATLWRLYFRQPLSEGELVVLEDKLKTYEIEDVRHALNGLGDEWDTDWSPAWFKVKSRLDGARRKRMDVTTPHLFEPEPVKPHAITCGICEVTTTADAGAPWRCSNCGVSIVYQGVRNLPDNRFKAWVISRLPEKARLILEGDPSGNESVGRGDHRQGEDGKAPTSEQDGDTRGHLGDTARGGDDVGTSFRVAGWSVPSDPTAAFSMPPPEVTPKEPIATVEHLKALSVPKEELEPRKFADRPDLDKRAEELFGEG